MSAAGFDVEVLESDELRRALTPRPTYTAEERDAFYGTMVYVGELLVRHGVVVIFDATASRRANREAARQRIPRFLEVFVDFPLEVCMARDPKGVYRRAREGRAATAPGLQIEYERPERPEIVIRGDREAPPAAARRVLDALRAAGLMEE